MKVAWYAEDLNNDTKVSSGFKLKHYPRTIKVEITLHPLRVYYKLTTWPAPRLLDSSVGKAELIIIVIVIVILTTHPKIATI